MQDAGGCLGCESSRGNCELEGSRSDVGEGELPIVAGEYLLAWGLILAS
jgi:hypothetical protein